MLLTRLAFYRAGGEAADDLSLEEQDEDEQRHRGRNHRGHRVHDVARLVDRAHEALDLGDHRLVVDPQKVLGDFSVFLRNVGVVSPIPTRIHTGDTCDVHLQ